MFVALNSGGQFHITGSPGGQGNFAHPKFGSFPSFAKCFAGSNGDGHPLAEVTQGLGKSANHSERVSLLVHCSSG